MIGLLVCFGGLLAAGLFFLAADLLRLPYLKTSKAMINTGRENRKAAKSLETYLLSLAVKLAPYIHMDEYKRGRQKNILKASGLNMEPEVYQAYVISKAGLVLLGVIPCLLVFPLLAVIVVVLAVMVYFKEQERADELLAKKRGELEGELPRFVSTIEQELKNAGKEFANELEILAADMRSSSYEAALTRFEARINSPMLSDVVRGLIGVLRGDDGAMYFQMLSHDFKQMELQHLKKEAQKIPPKIRVFSFLMLVCFIVTYLAIIVFEILKSMGSMF